MTREATRAGKGGGGRFGGALAIILGLALAGCGREAGPPPPLPVDQIPAAMNQVFVKCSPEAKNLVEEIEAALQATNYPAAYQEVQVLCGLPDASAEQRLVATRAMLTINGLLRELQSKGDPDAAAILKLQQRTR